MNELVIDIAGELAARRRDPSTSKPSCQSATASTLMIRLALEDEA